MSEPVAGRAGMSVLDRLLGGRPHSAGAGMPDTVVQARNALRRDIEALLNSRRPWRSVPLRFREARDSILNYGMPDFAGGVAVEPKQRERLRAEIADTIRRFEPRLSEVEVEIGDMPSQLDGILAFRISALMMIDPAPEPVVFDTTVDTTTADVDLRARSAG